MNTSSPFRSFDLDSTGADPSFVGHRLARLRREQNITPAQQAQALGIDLERLTALPSSRMPRDAAEVSMVASRMGWEAGRLADLLGVTFDLERESKRGTTSHLLSRFRAIE
jgi:transcriptional regulator with XRE-family HTH domain